MTAADSARCLRTSPSRVSMRPWYSRAAPTEPVRRRCVRWLMSRLRRASFAGRGVERGKARGAFRRRDDRWSAVDQAHEVGTPGQACGPAVEVEATGGRGRHANRELDVGRSSAGTRPSRRLASASGVPESPSAAASALRSTSDSVRPSRAARALSAGRKPRRSTVKYSRARLRGHEACLRRQRLPASQREPSRFGRSGLRHAGELCQRRRRLPTRPT